MAPQQDPFGYFKRSGDPSYYDTSGKLHITDPVSELVQGVGNFFSHLGRPASAAIQGDPTGRYIPGAMQKTFAASAPPVSNQPPSNRPPVTSPNTTVQASDDTYRQLLSQYGGAPGVEQLAMQTSLPTGFTPTGAKGPASLKDFYSAESQVGSRDMESIIPSLTKGLQGKDSQNIAEWAKANPMLAQREYAKKMSADQAAAGYSGTGPSDPAIRAAMSKRQYFQSEGSPSPIANPPEFGQPANKVPAPPAQQGAAVSAPFAQAQQKAAANTLSSDTMPNFATTQSPGKQYLDSVVGQALKASATGTLMNAMQGFFP